MGTEINCLRAGSLAGCFNHYNYLPVFIKGGEFLIVWATFSFSVITLINNNNNNLLWRLPGLCSLQCLRIIINCFPIQLGVFPGLSTSAREANHLPLSAAEGKNAWSHAFTTPYIVMVWCLINHRGLRTLMCYPEVLNCESTLVQMGLQFYCSFLCALCDCGTAHSGKLLLAVHGNCHI